MLKWEIKLEFYVLNQISTLTSLSCCDQAVCLSGCLIWFQCISSSIFILYPEDISADLYLTYKGNFALLCFSKFFTGYNLHHLTFSCVFTFTQKLESLSLVPDFGTVLRMAHCTFRMNLSGILIASISLLIDALVLCCCCNEQASHVVRSWCIAH